MIRWISLFLLLTLASPAAAQVIDQPTPDITQAERQLRFQLSGIHDIPQLDELAAIPNAKQMLYRIARTHDDSDLFHRERALRVLIRTGESDALALSRSLLQDPRTEEALIHVIILEMHVFGDPIIEDLERYLTHQSTSFRYSAITTLALLGSEAAVLRLHQAYAQESSEHVRQYIRERGRVIR